MPATDAKVASIEGARPIIEAIRAGRRLVHEIWIPEAAGSRAQRELRALALEQGIRVHAGSSERGPVARADPFPEEPFEALLAAAPPVLLVALDGVTDVGNLGSIARSAEASGAAGLILEERRAPPIGPGALRASSGALEHLRIGRAPRLVRALQLARHEGIEVLIAEAGAPGLERLDRSRVCGSVLWVFGSEDLGIRGAVRELATARVGIPQRGRVASLGVSAAAAYLLLRSAEIRASAPG